MALANYNDLVAAIQSFMMDRSDLAAAAPDFIALGESVIWYGAETNGITPDIPALRVRDMETVAAVALTGGVGPLPGDYLRYRRVVQTTNPRRELEYIAPAAAEQQYPTRAAGPGNHFTIIGQNLYTFPLVAGSCELTYYAAAAALTSDAPSNWLMTKHPGIYLRASLMQAAEWIKNDGELAKQAGLLRSLIAGMNKADQMASLAKAGVTFRTRVR
jgi:hypothetical protein